MAGLNIFFQILLSFKTILTNVSKEMFYAFISV